MPLGIDHSCSTNWAHLGPFASLGLKLRKNKLGISWHCNLPLNYLDLLIITATQPTFDMYPLIKCFWSCVHIWPFSSFRCKISSEVCRMWPKIHVNFDWKWSSGWLESWERLLLVTDVLTACAEAIFRLKCKWSILVNWKFKNVLEF